MPKWEIVLPRLRADLFSVILAREYPEWMNWFPEAWLKQHLDFPPINGSCRLQLRQQLCGPCGALAAIQAWFLKVILFDYELGERPEDLEDTETEELLILWKTGLVEALSTILWNARPYEDAPVRLIVAFYQRNTLDLGVFREYFESWQYCELKTSEDVKATISSNFYCVTQFGMVPFVCSLVMTRTIPKIRRELGLERLVDLKTGGTRDTLLNLILVGRPALRFLDGIVDQTTIGVLSCYEYDPSVPDWGPDEFTGESYKRPRYPIWIIRQPGHASVLFCKNREVFTRRPVEEMFYWYTIYGAVNGMQISRQYSIWVDTTDKVHRVDQYLQNDIYQIELAVKLLWPTAKVTYVSHVDENEDVYFWIQHHPNLFYQIWYY